MKGTSNLQIIENDNGEKYKIKRRRARYMFIKKNRKGCRKWKSDVRVTIEWWDNARVLICTWIEMQRMQREER